MGEHGQRRPFAAIQEAMPQPFWQDKWIQYQFRALARISIGLGLGLTGLSMGIAWGARGYVQSQVLPIIKTSLEKTVGHPVELGELTYIWPWQIVLGKSRIQNLATIESIEIAPDLWRLVSQQQLTVNLTLDRLQMTLIETRTQGWLPLHLDTNPQNTQSFPISQVNLGIRNGQITAVPLFGAAQTLTQVQAKGSHDFFAKPGSPALFDLRALLQDKPIRAQGEAQLDGNGSVRIVGQQLSLDLLPSVVRDLPLTSITGRGDLDLKLAWQPSGQIDVVSGSVQVSDAALKLKDLPLPLTDIQGQIELDRRTVGLQKVQTRYGRIPLEVNGSLYWQAALPQDPPSSLATAGYQIQAAIPKASLSDLEQTFGLTVPVKANALIGATVLLDGHLDRPRLQGQFQSLAAGWVDQVPISRYAGRFQLANNTLTFDQLQIQAAGGKIQGSGQVPLTSGTSQFQFNVQGANTDTLATLYNARLPKSLGLLGGKVLLELPPHSDPRLNAQWQVTGGEIQGRGQLDWIPSSTTISNAQLALGGGTATANATIQNGQVVAQISPQRVGLDLLAPNQKGQVSGQVMLQASLSDPSLRGLRAVGNLNFPQGLDPVPGPIQANVTWDGSVLNLRQAQIVGIASVRGKIPVDPDRLTIGSLDLQIEAKDQSLARIPQLPTALNAQGRVSLDARLTGRLDHLLLQGNARLQQVQAGGLRFADLQGPIFWDPKAKGTQIDLRGNGDRVALDLDPKFLPRTLTLQQGSIRATGIRQGDELDLQASQVPLALFGGIANIAAEGKINAAVKFNLVSGRVQGQAELDQFKVNGIQAKQIKAAFDYTQDQLILRQASLQLLDSTSQASGSVKLSGSDRTPQLNLQVSTTQGRLQDIIAAFKWSKWSDIPARGFSLPPFGPASVVADTTPITVQDQPLYRQLETYSRAVSERNQALSQIKADLFPPPTAVSGNFQAKVDVTGSLTQPKIGFQLKGQGWTAEELRVDSLMATGQLSASVFELQSFKIQTGDRSGSFQGRLAATEQRGSVQLVRVPLSLLHRFIPDSPLKVVGDLNANLEIAGNLQNPSAIGTVTLDQGQLNQIPLTSAKADLSYIDGKLTLNSTIFPQDPETGKPTQHPILILGSVPYKLPFATVAATSDQLDVRLDMKDEGLKLLTSLSDQVTWEGGDSTVQLQVNGTLEEPIIKGNLGITNGTLKFKALPTPITNLQAQVAFNLNQLEVTQFKGRFGQGSITATGILPINSQGSFNPDDVQAPLSVQLDQLDLDLPKFYKGKLNGTLTVGGVLLRPLIGGKLMVSNGEVDVSPHESAPAVSADPSDPGAGWKPELAGLQLVLGSNTEIISGQLFRFTASGSLDISGTPDRLKPVGTINLDKGRINVALANFRLDRSRPNQAVFDLNGGLDPFLDLRLVTQATEVYRFPNDLALFNRDRNVVGSQQSVEVLATVRGRASELSQSSPNSAIVELTSNPRRTQQEIVALLGGNALATLSTGADVAGFAGSTILRNLQDILGDTLGLDEVRLGPVVQAAGNVPNRFSVGLGLEVAKDLGPQTSVSIQRNLTDPVQPTRYSARYRLNPEVLTRVSTDFRGNNTAAIEFETRF